jgi:predicted metal-dependent phosphoesterase TrpH
MKADLHLHTTASDGRLSPQEMVRKAVDVGLSVIAITDHDSITGIQPALEEATKFPSLRVIPGVEINTDFPSGEVHILGYFINFQDPELIHVLEELHNSRYVRGAQMVAKLATIGVDIDWDRVLELASGGCVGRPHIAQALLEKGHVSSIREAFNKYIGRNGIAHVGRRKPTTAEAVALILKANGLPFLAHPADISELDSLVYELKKAGLVGMEIYYANYSPAKITRLEKLADSYKLMASGGSDYHGPDTNIGTIIGGIDIPEESVQQFISLAEKKRMVIQ